MSLAPAAYLLFQKVMRRDPSDNEWIGRDRFILSAGHSSLTQYMQLYFGGDGLELDDLEALRTWGSKTPGHPEYGHTDGVEITTGPLGQGISSAVGFAYASRFERGLFDPDAAPGTSPFDHFVYVIAGDGDLEEGVTSEASSLAGHQELGNLIASTTATRSRSRTTPTSRSPKTCRRGTRRTTGTSRSSTGRRRASTAKTSRAPRRDPRRAGGHRQAVADHPEDDHRLAAPEEAEHGQDPRSALGADELAAVKKVLGFDPEDLRR